MRNIQKLRDAHKASSHNKDLVKRSTICPDCFIDSVLPDASGIPLDRDFVAEMHRYWFGR